ncbi:hypothetical protein ACN27G_01095 [Plantactinospora sp. WMMB334]|uniref:hypothetical protein n=1 Tax=Plantactinospora sp. WMMB334 TaxID=3404119 RepID=UPI003B942D08
MAAVLCLPATQKPPATAAEFLDLLEQGGGSVQVVGPSDTVRAAWRRFLHAVKRSGEVPSGWHLLHRGRDSGDLTMELRRGEHPFREYQRSAQPSRIPVSEELVDPHPVVNRLRDMPHRLPASTQNRSRTLMIIQALADAAQARGHRVKSGPEDVLTVVEVDGEGYGVRIFEETGARWSLRLVLQVDGAGGEPARWTDYARRRVEDDLAEVLAEIERRAAAVRVERETEQRVERQRLEDKRQRRIIKRRDKVLRAEVAAWRLAQDIRGHCDELEVAGMPVGDPWLVWAREYAARIDPLADAPGLPPDASPDEDDRDEPRAAPTDRASDCLPSLPKPWHPNRRWYHG